MGAAVCRQQDMSGTLKLHRTPLHRAEQTAGTPFGGGADVAYDGDQKLATVTWSPVRDFVRRLAHRRLGRADMADDVAQETLLRLIEYQRGGRIDNLYGLATRIAENLVNEEYRRERRWRVEGLSETLASGQPSPERVVEGREAVEVLKRALKRMPRLRREIIIRRRIHRQGCRRPRPPRRRARPSPACGRRSSPGG